MMADEEHKDDDAVMPDEEGLPEVDIDDEEGVDVDGVRDDYDEFGNRLEE